MLQCCVQVVACLIRVPAVPRDVRLGSGHWARFAQWNLPAVHQASNSSAAPKSQGPKSHVGAMSRLRLARNAAQDGPETWHIGIKVCLMPTAPTRVRMRAQAVRARRAAAPGAEEGGRRGPWRYAQGSGHFQGQHTGTGELSNVIYSNQHCIPWSFAHSHASITIAACLRRSDAACQA